MSIAWHAIPQHVQVDVMLAEQLRHREMAAVVLWAHMCDKARLRQAMEERGRVWDRNQLPSGIQRMFLQTATYYVGTDWRALQVRHHLLLVLGNQKT